jgi:hypothetical protein
MSIRWYLLLGLSVAGLLTTDAVTARLDEKPAATITSPKDRGVVSQVDELEGSLVASSGHPVVLVRPTGDEPWWIQPLVEEIEDGQFTAKAHFGDDRTSSGTRFKVVVLVVKDQKAAREYKAGTTLKVLPPGVPRSAEVIVFRAAMPPEEKPAGPRLLSFAGYNWTVKKGPRLGPGPNNWSDDKESAWVDEKGQLHLTIRKQGKRWVCSEVIAPRSLGHDEYRWVVSGDLPDLAPQTVLGLFTYETTTREIDFELSRWSDPTRPNAQFVVQPHTARGNVFRFDLGKRKLFTCSMQWTNEFVRCRCWDGEDTTQEPLADWKYTGRHNPPPGRERARANFWLFDGKPPAAGKRLEVVIRSFRFTAAFRDETCR